MLAVRNIAAADRLVLVSAVKKTSAARKHNFTQSEDANMKKYWMMALTMMAGLSAVATATAGYYVPSCYWTTVWNGWGWIYQQVCY